MVWGGVTYSDVRNIIDLSSTQVSDSTLTSLITLSGAKFNEDVSVKVIEERADYIDNYRENKRNGSNTYYYTHTSWDWYLGDLDDDGDVDTSDVKAWIYNPSAKTKTAATVTAVDETGKITLSAAPASNEIVRITYRYMPISITHPLVKQAVCELAAMYAYTKSDASNLTRVSIGRLDVSKASGGSAGYKTFKAMYEQTLSKINARQMFRKQQAPVRIPDVQPYGVVKEQTTNTGANLG